MKNLLLLLLFATAFALEAPPVRYDGYEVYRITPQTIQQLQSLQQLEERPDGFNFWQEASVVGRDVDLMVPPHLKAYFKNFTKAHNLQETLWVQDVQQRIDNEKRNVPRASADPDWKDYQTLEEINDWLDSLVLKFPDVVTPIIGGQSYQGRQIRGVRVSYSSGQKVAFIEGGIHAREWISPATVTYILNEFLTSNDSAVQAVARSREWHIFPSVNPDGYVYTHRTERLWRKTRKPYGTTCFGADPNRNWDYHWMDGGASEDPCGEIHAGSAAFSEIETQTLSKYISSVVDNMDIYLSFHSYSQILLIPFGHAELEVPENNDELHAIGDAAAESIAQRYGTNYTVQNIPDAVNVASGGSVDWVLGKHRNVRLVYAFELRDKGEFGFVLPPEQIIPTGQETLDGVVRIVQEADKVSASGGSSPAQVFTYLVALAAIVHRLFD